MNSLDLIEAARRLVAPARKPSEACLRRATSTAYYAVFHCLAREGADLFIGGLRAKRSQHAWVQTYRALEHGHAKTQCERIDVIQSFPKGIGHFADVFKRLQKKRHDADYDPVAKFSRLAVQGDIVMAERAILGFRSESASDRRAFCAWVLFRAAKT